jgi:hypothetical protein
MACTVRLVGANLALHGGNTRTISWHRMGTYRTLLLLCPEGLLHDPGIQRAINYLHASNFAAGTVDVLDATYTPVNLTVAADVAPFVAAAIANPPIAGRQRRKDAHVGDKVNGWWERLDVVGDVQGVGVGQAAVGTARTYGHGRTNAIAFLVFASLELGYDILRCPLADPGGLVRCDVERHRRDSEGGREETAEILAALEELGGVKRRGAVGQVFGVAFDAQPGLVVAGVGMLDGTK